MTLDWGYLAGVALFGAALLALVVSQISAKRFHVTLYWTTIVASTTFGTTLADFADRSLGIGYTGGSLVLLGCLLATLALWRWLQGTEGAPNTYARFAETARQHTRTYCAHERQLNELLSGFSAACS